MDLSVVRLGGKPATDGRTDRRRARRDDRSLDPCQTRGFEKTCRAVDVGTPDLAAASGRECIEGSGMDQKPAAAERLREISRSSKVAVNNLTPTESRQTVTLLADQGADRITRGEQLAQHVPTDESCGSGQEHEIAR